MSRMFRAVKEEWSAATDQFVDYEHVMALLDGIGKAVDSPLEQSEYAETTSVHFEKGTAVLDYIEQKLTIHRAAELLTQADYDDYDTESLDALVGNMQLFAANEWRRSIGQHGELIFYVD